MSDFPCVHSNLGGNTINEVALEFWRAGRAREEIPMELLEQRLQLELQEAAGKSWACSGGLWAGAVPVLCTHGARCGGTSPGLLTMRAPSLVPASQGTWGGSREAFSPPSALEMAGGRRKLSTTGQY